jgi:NADH-quinone oxidoreductase subunit M
MNFPILTVIVFLPLVGAAVMAALPKSREELAKPIGLVFGLVEIAFAAWLVVAFKSGNAHAGFQFVSKHSWIGDLGVSWNVGVDGISLFLVAMTALLFPVAMSGPQLARSPRSFLGWMLLLEAACILTFISLDVFLFFVAFEVTLVPGYFVIAGWGGARRGYAAMKFFLYTFAGSAFLFVGILGTFLLVSARSGSANGSFDLITLARGAMHLPINDQEWLFASFAIAFAVKIPLLPFHTWMPDAYSQAPTGGSMVLAGILFKLGAYGILRFGVFLFPAAAVNLAPVLLTLAAIAVIYGSIVAIMQRDLKRLVAYGSLADVAFIVIGLFGFTTQGITGGVVEMVNHGLTTGALFFLVGMVWERRRTYQIAELGGLQKAAPLLGWVFLAVIMSAVGLPGLNGFVGEFLVLVGTFITHRWWAVVATFGVVIGAVYLLWAYQRVFQGPGRAANAKVLDMSWRERGAILPLLVGIVFIGIYPKPLVDRIQPAVNHLINHVQYADPSLQLPQQGVGQGNFAVPSNQNVNVPNASSTSSSASGATSGANP